MRNHTTQAALALAVLLGSNLANATTITILDNAANDQVQILLDGNVVLTQPGSSEGTAVLLFRNPFPLHPPTTAFLTVNFTEPGAAPGAGISDTLSIVVTPDNMGTSSLNLSFNSDGESGLNAITGPGVQLIAEAAGGNAVITNNAGFVDSTGKAINATDFSGGGVLSVTVFSDTDIPEPSTALLVISGIIVVQSCVTRRRATNKPRARNSP